MYALAILFSSPSGSFRGSKNFQLPLDISLDGFDKACILLAIVAVCLIIWGLRKPKKDKAGLTR